MTIMDDALQISFAYIPPVAFLSDSILIYLFWRLNQYRNHPEIMVFWQSVSRIIYNIHWITGIRSVHSSISPEYCLAFGSITAYFYILTWDYVLILSIEVLLKIRNPHKHSYKKRMIIYHVVSNLVSTVVFIVLITSGTNGRSSFHTCYIENYTPYEIISFIPIIIHFPICLSIIVYSIYASYNTFYAEYLKYNLVFVVIFLLTWVPSGINRGIFFFNNEKGLSDIYTIISILLSELSSLFILIARIIQGRIFNIIYRSIFVSKKKRKINLRVSIIAPDVAEDKTVEIESMLFCQITNQGITDILLALINVLQASENYDAYQFSTIGKNIREWIFSLGSKKMKVIVNQYYSDIFETIMHKSSITYSSIIQSFKADKDLKNICDRINSSGGRSGAFFYFTSDREFILKSISSEELKIFSSMIHDYQNRVCSNQGSLITKVFGIFKFKFDKLASSTFILMENLRSQLVNPLIFDMKGSTLHRKTGIDKSSPLIDLPRNLVYKDMDFMEKIPRFVIAKKNYDKIVQIIKEDTKMLCKNNIMDYSMLLMYEDSPSLKSTLIDKMVTISEDNKAVVIGIIDFLQKFTFKKKLESKYYRLNASADSELSSIPPKPYRLRFIEMAANVFTPDRLK